jgi:predicted nuclease with TOPRIM domain
LLITLKEKDLQLDSMRRQINQLKEDCHQQELEYDTVQRRLNSDDKQRSILDQQDTSRLRREMDTLERNFADLEC